MTMIGRVADGLPLAASVHNDIRDDVKYFSFIYYSFYLFLKSLVWS